MKWQKLAVVVTAIVAVVAIAPMARGVTLKAQINGEAVDQGSVDSIKPVKFTSQDIVKACASANDLKASDLTLVIVLDSDTDATAGELWVASKKAVTNLVCDIATVNGGVSSTLCKAGSKSSKTQVVFTFNVSGAVSNVVSDIETLDASGVAKGSATDDSTDCSGGTILGAGVSGSFGGVTDTQIVQGTIKVSGKNLE